MMKITIICPKCGKVINFPKLPDMESRLVTCPKCKYKGPFTKYKLVEDQDVGGGSVPPPVPGGNVSSGNGGTPPPPPVQKDPLSAQREQPISPPPQQVNLLPGQLRDESNGYVYELKIGRNVIGRQSNTSNADIQIPTDGDNRMSRSHLVINVSMVTNRGLVPVASLFKSEVNATYINGKKLSINDRVELKEGDTISLPGKTLRYEIPDMENTVM